MLVMISLLLLQVLRLPAMYHTRATDTITSLLKAVRLMSVVD